MSYRDHIRSWLVYYGYNKALTRATVQLYHASLAELDKTRLYKEFWRPDLKIYIIVSSDALTHSTDIPDINQSVQYSIPLDKSVNMQWQQFKQAAQANGRTREAIFLLNPQYKGPCKAARRPNKTYTHASRGFRPQLSELSRKYLVARGTLQEDRAADFASNISPKISVSSNTGSDISATVKRRELSPRGTTVILPADILAVKPTQRPRIDAKRRAALPNCLYAFANKKRVCLRQLILNNYREISFKTNTRGCCSNCDSSLRAYDEFNIHTQSSTDIIAPRRRQLMFANIKKWFSDWVDRKYQDTIQIAFPEYIISNQQIGILCLNGWLLTSLKSFKQFLPDWNYKRLGDNLGTLIQFLQKENNRFCTAGALQALSKVNLYISNLSQGLSQGPLQLREGQKINISTSHSRLMQI